MVICRDMPLMGILHTLHAMKQHVLVVIETKHPAFQATLAIASSTMTLYGLLKPPQSPSLQTHVGIMIRVEAKKILGKTPCSTSYLVLTSGEGNTQYLIGSRTSATLYDISGTRNGKQRRLRRGFSHAFFSSSSAIRQKESTGIHMTSSMI